MERKKEAASRGITRRRALAGGAAGASAALGGCVREIRNVVRRAPDNQLSLTIATVPGDDDPQAIQLATTVQESLDAAGINADLAMLTREEFYREILINHDYELFVGQHPGGFDPDFLYEALHSRFADEWGWQNPFGFTNITFDDRLERQRSQTGEQRRLSVAELLRSVANEQPLTSICKPTECRLVDENRFDGWDRYHLADRLAYLAVNPAPGVTELRGVITDARPTQNLNPLSAEYRHRAPVVDLLYDSLGTYDGEEIVPWLARDWEWEDDLAIVSLRDATWHDGERVTASDVAFTYRFLEDTSLGRNDVLSPSPVYRGRATAVDEVVALDDRRVRIQATKGTEAAENAFTIPILPEHLWTERTEEAEFPGVDTAEGTTEAVVTDNVPPIGSGPYAFVERSERDRLDLERHDDHFTVDLVDPPTPRVKRFRIDVVPSTGAAIEAIEAGDADVTVSALDPEVVVDYEPAEGVSIVESPSRTVYCLGFNARMAPLGNPYFRRTVASLLDKEHLIGEVFAGKGEPVATPIAGEWLPSSLEWAGSDPVTPFLGTDGELDEAAVRAAFEDLGYRYDEDGNLLVRN